MLAMDRMASTPFLIAVCLASLSCAEAAPPPPGVIVRDSGGVEIVENLSPALGSDAWSIDPEPRVEIGTVDGGEPYVFTRVWDATRLPDGRLVVVDEMSLEIRVYTPDGDHLVTFGGGGEGPEEFGGPAFVRSTADGQILAWDGGRQRLTRFNPEGELVEETSLSEALSAHGVFPFRNGPVWEIDSDGTLLSTGPVRPGRGEGLRESFRRIVVVDNDAATSHDFGHVPSGQSFVVRTERASVGVGNPYAPSTRAGLDVHGNVVIADPEVWGLSVYTVDGTLKRIVRADIPRLVVTEELREEGFARTRWVAETSPLTLQQAEDAYASISLPDSVPAIGSVAADGSHLWVGRRVGRWFEVGAHDVFDQDGRWLTTVTMPSEIQAILEIGDDYLLAHVQDELEISYVRSYAIRK